MRKWGVNWTYLKKEPGSEEIASKMRSKMDGDNNKRANYVEVHAAVIERQERERSSAAEEEGDMGHASSLEDVTKHDHKSEIQLNPPGKQQARKHSLTSTPAASNKSLLSVPRVDTDTDATDISEDVARPVPIQAQPQAKVMMIPGIHASHRGEVMSMGNVAPQPSVLSGSLKSKNPTIQSMYQLWNRPAGMDQNLHVSGKATGSEADIPLSLSPSQTSKLMQRTPPPLPPRKFPGTSSLLNETEIPESIGTTKAEGELVSFSDDTTVHTTTLTISSIDAPPPLPPRRLSSTA